MQPPNSEKHPPKIWACDIDVDSVRIARENAALNHANGIKFYEGSISKETASFDFVCANVTADVIIPILPLLVKKSTRILVLSGILSEQEREVRHELRKLGIRETDAERMGEWISLTIRKQNETN